MMTIILILVVDFAAKKPIVRTLQRRRGERWKARRVQPDLTARRRKRIVQYLDDPSSCAVCGTVTFLNKPAPRRLAAEPN